MKYFLWIVGVIVALLGALYFVLFSNYGNALVKPYIQKEAQKYVQNDLKIVSFTLKPKFLDVEVLLDDTSRVIFNGDYSVFDKSFNISYMLGLKDIKSPYATIQGIIALKGRIQGDIKDFSVDADGEIFGAKTRLNSHIKNQQIKSIDIDTKNLHVEKVLALVKQPIYSKGFIDINAKVLPTPDGKIKGDGKININFGQLNQKEISKSFGIELPANVTYRGDIDFVVDKEQVRAKANIISNLLKVSCEHIIYEIPTDKLYTDYVLNIPSLDALKKVVGLDLYGKLSVIGDVIKDKEGLKLNAYSKTLGGEVTASLVNDTATLKVKNASMSELFKMLKAEKYSNGVLNSHVEVSSLKEYDFQSLTTISNASLDKKVLQSLLEKKDIPEISYSLELRAGGRDKVVELDSSLKSSLAQVKLSESNYDINKKLLVGKYNLHVDSLEKLEFLVDKKLSSKFDTNGEIKYQNEKLELNGESDFLEAKTTYTLKDDILNLRSDELLVQNITSLLNYPQVFESYATLVAQYDIKNKKGQMQLDAINGQLTSSQLTTLVSTLTNFDMTEEIYKQTILKSIVDNEKLDFSLVMEGLNSSLKVENGKLNTKSKQLEAKFDVKVKNKDLSGKISGNIQSPKVSIDSSDYIKQKLDKQIDKHVPDEWKAPVKDLLNLFG